MRKQFMDHALSALRSAPCFLGALSLALGIPAEAQQVALNVPRIGYLAHDSRSAGAAAFLQGLRDLGYVEGQNIAIERRFADGKEERFTDLAAELIQLKVDVIVVGGTAAAYAAQRLTKTIPIVIPDSANPLRAGLAESFARPGRNITGLTIMSARLGAKRLELLKEVLPKIFQVAVIIRSANPDRDPSVKELKTSAPSLGMQVQVVAVQEANEIENIFATITRSRFQAFVLIPTPLFTYHRQAIVARASENRLASIYPHRGYVEAGGLMSYAANPSDLFRRAASYVDKILKGANPADLPIEQPTKFEFVINLKTARQIGVNVPPHVLMWADQVIK
jgi:putative ABC transport system substrate-binding protein